MENEIAGADFGLRNGLAPVAFFRLPTIDHA
jgi:hypothetical protein